MALTAFLALVQAVIVLSWALVTVFPPVAQVVLSMVLNLASLSWVLQVILMVTVLLLAFLAWGLLVILVMTVLVCASLALVKEKIVLALPLDFLALEPAVSAAPRHTAPVHRTQFLSSHFWET